jgi:predicted TIM-barrel fold metal-dependent hydrolase
VAIDIHVHPQTEEFVRGMGARRKQMAGHLKKERPAISFESLAETYESRNMMAVLLNSDDETRSGIAPASNDLIGDAVRAHPDTFLPFCGIDPWKGELAIAEIRRCHEEFGAIGVGELNPSRQRFRPDDPRFGPIWETCVELGMVVMFHAGFPAGGAGTPGGMGYEIDLVRPVPYLDRLAARYPGLTIIGAHPGWPWHLENLAVAQHKANYYIDLSGWSPKYLPADVVHYANSVIPRKVLFGTDWPVLEPDRWMSEFDALGFKDTSRARILKENAMTVLGLEEAL